MSVKVPERALCPRCAGAEECAYFDTACEQGERVAGFGVVLMESGRMVNELDRAFTRTWRARHDQGEAGPALTASVVLAVRDVASPEEIAAWVAGTAVKA